MLQINESSELCTPYLHVQGQIDHDFKYSHPRSSKTASNADGMGVTADVAIVARNYGNKQNRHAISRYICVNIRRLILSGVNLTPQYKLLMYQRKLVGDSITP